MNRPAPRPLQLGSNSASYTSQSNVGRSGPPVSELPYRPESPAPSVASPRPQHLTASNVEAMNVVNRPTANSPFRLHPPSHAGVSRQTSPTPSPSGAPYLSPADVGAGPSLSNDAPYWPTPQDLRGSHEHQRRMQAELRARPLNESEYGRVIVALLGHPWVTAPSGLATVVFPPGTEDGLVDDTAHYINALVCGAHAYRNASAGVLSVSGLAKLNRLFERAGLSPIVVRPAPDPWLPMAARTPPDFLVEGFGAQLNPDQHAREGGK